MRMTLFFDTQMIVRAVACGCRLGKISIPARYFPEASSIDYLVRLRYGIQTLGMFGIYPLRRTSMYRSLQFVRAASTKWQHLTSLPTAGRHADRSANASSSDGELR
jgi:hypothetical protein